ncbi:uncharacterized protein ANIA_10051 [Aspergillus nidulans FGSC A4]|uniref:Uncharacterized protein n=1 Tax=Emericella nidulans (strain FGSC A4 / ATCC 38163 / CBS 112.46 / NRRL 194 / M139) TaxID=227321 RepID=C8VUB9_EMENI|nr:hypothetical protein [Aspergillus nidulans FGSC A4]CBF89815.1 TPA: hypothetical protein ANIA_10051 [Aspergillus nidulans FGSC A4]
MTTRQNDERRPNHTVDSADSICTISCTSYLMTSLKHKYGDIQSRKVN